ncbi:MAG: hypothetical protein ACYCOY_12265 [Metallibacterium sp.]
MKIIEADDPYKILSGLLFYDVLIFTCQSMWHLKDWILNDPRFGAKDIAVVKAEIHASPCLLVCSDLANGTKHLSLNCPKTGGTLSEHTGVHIDPAKGIFLEFYYITCRDSSDKFHGMEVRALLRQCRDTWAGIINRYHLSVVDVGMAQQGVQADGPAFDGSAA